MKIFMHSFNLHRGGQKKVTVFVGCPSPHTHTQTTHFLTITFL